MSEANGIAAVVLNYKTWQDAVNCVNDLKAQDWPHKHIVVVENGSGNESEQELLKRFGGDPMVTVLVSKKNLGFARGNNLGIRYAHEKLGYDTVFVVNSDIRAESGLFGAIAAFDMKGVGAVSPTVLCADGELQPFPVNCEDIRRHAGRCMANLLKANIAALPPVDALYKRRSKVRASQTAGGWEGPRRWALQGCAYFLTPDFFRHYRGLYPRTFLYWEEIDLMLMLRKAGLCTAYAETPAVTHLGERSTKNISDNIRLFHIRQSNRSMFKSLPLILGMGERRAARCVERSPEFTCPLE